MIYTVKSLVDAAGSTLKRGFSRVQVAGEVGEYKVYGSGHAYGVLKDDTSSMQFMVFQRDRNLIPFQPQVGLQVVLTGKLDIYFKNGKFQLIATAMEPVGVGAQDLALKQLREKLASEGLLDVERKQPIPKLCRRIGVVTSPSGAVIRDILTVLDRRCGGLDVTIHPCRVQGPDSPGEITSALLAADAEGYDVIIVARGGGSAEDLSSFNTEQVARSIVVCRTPVISAVGHETDTTLSDDVADLRAATPSQAAEIVSSDLKDVVRRLERAIADIRHVGLRVKEWRHRLKTIANQVDWVQLNVKGKRFTLSGYRRTLSGYDPQATLRRGYAIVRDRQGAVISTADAAWQAFTEGELIIQFADKSVSIMERD